MSRVGLSSRDRRTLVAGAAAILGIVLAGRGIPAWRQWRDDTVAAARELSRKRARTRAVLSAYPAIRDTAAARRARVAELEQGLIRASTPAAASATLAGFVGESAAETGVRLGGLQVTADSVAGKRYQRVRVSTEGTGGVREITTFVARLESTDARVVVREFALTQADPAASSARPETLRMTIVIEALAVRESANGGPPRAGRPEPDSSRDVPRVAVRRGGDA